VFVDPTQEAVRFAKACGADRVVADYLALLAADPR
jgi:hypothetical protein